MEKSAATSARTRTTLIVVVSIFIVAAVLVAMVPLLMTLFKGGGVKTEGIDANKVSAASTELDGDWEVTNLSLIHI